MIIRTAAGQICAEVGIKHGLTERQVREPSRLHARVAARNEAMWRVRTELAWSYPQIGRWFAKDHTTCRHGILKHQRAVDYVARLQANNDAIMAQMFTIYAP